MYLICGSQEEGLATGCPHLVIRLWGGCANTDCMPCSCRIYVVNKETDSWEVGRGTWKQLAVSRTMITCWSLNVSCLVNTLCLPAVTWKLWIAERYFGNLKRLEEDILSVARCAVKVLLKFWFVSYLTLASVPFHMVDFPGRKGGLEVTICSSSLISRTCLKSAWVAVTRRQVLGVAHAFF